MTRQPSEPRPRAALDAVIPYEWELSTEVIAARLGRDVSEVVRFDTNTVPWRLVAEGPPITAINEYPDTSYGMLVRAIAEYCGRSPGNIVVGAGADELISLVAQAYLERGRVCAMSDPTYAMFSVSSRVAGAEPLLVPCRPDLRVDVGALAAAAHDAAVTWLANPDNPTGAQLAQADVRTLARECGGLLVVDEAYCEFAGASALEWIDSAPNVAVVRTLSKAFGLAGARVGYLVAADEVVATINKVRPVSSIAVTSAHLAVAALRRTADMRSLVGELILERHRLAQALGRSGRRVIEGSANFLLVEADGAEVAAAASQGLVVRAFGAGHRLSGLVRVTVRSPADNERLLAAWGATPPRDRCRT